MTNDDAQTYRFSHAPAAPIAELFLLRILDDTPSWMDSASCVNYPDIDFASYRVYPEAVAVCKTCPVREQCLELGVEGRAEVGVFGGEDIYDYLHPEVVARREKEKKEQEQEQREEGD